MLGLKQYLAVRPRRQHVSLDDLPTEVIDVILELLYTDGGQRAESILPLSFVNRKLRRSALSILCREILCVLRGTESGDDSSLGRRGLNIDHLLRHGRTLCVRTVPDIIERRYSIDLGWEDAITLGWEDAIRSHNMLVLQYYISRMPQLQLVKVDCSLLSAIDLLSILKDQIDVRVHFVSVFHTSSSHMILQALANEFTRLLDGRTLALGSLDLFDMAATTFNPMAMVSSLLSPSSQTSGPKSIQALSLNNLSSHMALDLSWLRSPLCALEELYLSNVRAARESSGFPWHTIPWSNLRRLHIQGIDMIVLSNIIPSLSSLRSLHLTSYTFFDLHPNCPFGRGAFSSGTSDSLLTIDFTSIPQLQSLSIEGVCSHVPILNVVCSSLRSLRLHRPYLTYPNEDVGGAFGQRTPTDLIEIARKAPLIEILGLDIGSIQNLWHPTAIPGVNVDPKLYTFLAALSNFRQLRTLHLFPTHVVPDYGSRLRSTTTAGAFSSSLTRLPLCSDQQAIRLFNHLRQQNPKLTKLFILPALLEINLLYHEPIARTWELRSWGEKTLLITRQMGNDYDLRETWIGDRKLSSEVKRDGYKKGLGVNTEWNHDWILPESSRTLSLG